MSRPKSIIVVNKDYIKLSNRFYQYQKRLGYVLDTCRSRQLYADEFLHYLEGCGLLEIDKITTADIVCYYEYISERPNKQGEGILNPKTTFSQIKVVELLFTMLQEYGEVDINPTSGLNIKYSNEMNDRSYRYPKSINCTMYVSRLLNDLY